MSDVFNKITDRKVTTCLKWNRQASSDCIPFWIADSDYETIPEVVNELCLQANHGVFGYNAVPKEFYKAIINWYKKRYNSNVEEEWIVPTSGVVLEIRILLDVLTKEGEGVIIQTPVYHVFHNMIKGMNRKIIENKLLRIDNTYKMDFDNLEKLFKDGHKVMILCSPHNPVGRIWNKEEIGKVFELAKKYGVFLIVDEIHSDLNISNIKFISAVDYINEYNNFVVCNAPSKTFNIAGLFTSYLISPNSEIKDLFIKQVKRECLNDPTVFGYSALIKAYEYGDNWVDMQNEHLKKNYDYLKEYLNTELPLLKVTKLEGTYLVWLDLSFTRLNTEELLKKCSENGITCSGGVNFGSDYESFIRFNIACPISQIEEGLKRLVKAFKDIK